MPDSDSCVPLSGGRLRGRRGWVLRAMTSTFRMRFRRSGAERSQPIHDRIRPGRHAPADRRRIYLNDVEGLVLHEIGHALGLGHSDVIAGVMCGYVFPGDVFDAARRLHARRSRSRVRRRRRNSAIYGPAAPAVPLSPVAGVVLGGLLAAYGRLARPPALVGSARTRDVPGLDARAARFGVADRMPLSRRPESPG